MKISSKEKGYLVIVVLIVVIGLFYKFVYVPTGEARTSATAQYVALQEEYSNAERRIAEKDNYEKSIAEAKQELLPLLEGFYDDTLQEDFIRKIVQLEDDSNNVMISIGFLGINDPVSNGLAGVAMPEQENLPSFFENLSVTSASISFSSSYKNVYDFVKKLNENDKVIVSNQITLSAGNQSVNINPNDISAVAPAKLIKGISKDSDQKVNVSTSIYFFMADIDKIMLNEQ